MSESIVQRKSFAFALDIIRLYCRLRDEREWVMSKQVLRSGTSIGANVEEANAGQSRKDFVARMSIASREARETRYWLRLLRESELTDIDVSSYIASVEELVRMLTSIVKTTNERDMPSGEERRTTSPRPSPATQNS